MPRFEKPISAPIGPGDGLDVPPALWSDLTPALRSVRRAALVQRCGASAAPPHSEAGPRKPEPRPSLSRRDLLRNTGMLAAAAALAEAPGLFEGRGWGTAAAADPVDLVTDTFNGLVAFIVPGPDDYSMHQGVSTPEPGGIAAAATPGTIFALGFIQLAPPPFATFSQLVAFVLNNVAEAIHGGVPAGPFGSSFANLTFAEKVTVFAVLEAGLVDPALISLAGALPFFVAFIAYSELGVFNPATRTLVGQPVGWTLSSYDGVADGRADFKGYFQNRRQADG
jgi:hypothetical protein